LTLQFAAKLSLIHGHRPCNPHSRTLETNPQRSPKAIPAAACSAADQGPKVTFLALCFNHAPYILECLRSIEAQNYRNSELIILDNNSADGSQEILQDWAASSGGSVKLLLEKERRGICANINRMLAHSTGDYVALISTDDYWLPEKISRQVEALERHGETFVVSYSDALCVGADGSVLDPSSFIQRHRQTESLPSGDVLHELIRGPFIPAMSTLVRRSALLAMGPYDESLIYEDYDAWLRLAEHWHFHADPEPLCAYRILNSSMIRTVAAQDKPEKLLSDAFIMAKVAAMPRLDEKTRINTKRRIINLAIQLLSLPNGDWSKAIGDLQSSTHLTTLSLLGAARAHRQDVSTDDFHGLLVRAATLGFLPTEELVNLPKPVTNLLPKGKRLAPARFHPFPEGHDTSAWEQIYKQMERESELEDKTKISAKKSSWWKFGLR
jgi:glycosyltransferase involved in cell wall biosynthesis